MSPVTVCGFCVSIKIRVGGEMISDRTIRMAEDAAAALRQRGEADRAGAVEALIEAAREQALPTLDLITTTEAGELIGVTAQTIKNWVRDGRLRGFRVGGRIMIPTEAISEYVRRARGSLDLEEMSDVEAAALVAEGRQRP
jgi:excisionase family DNA binding protein